MKQESFNKHAVNPHLYLNYVGTEICSPDFLMPPHVRREYLIHYVLSGHGSFTTAQKTFDVEPGSLFLIRPGVLSSYRTDPKDPFHFSWFAFSGDLSDTVLLKVGFFGPICVRHLHSRFSIHEDIMDCISLLENSPVSSEYGLLSLLFGIFGKMQASYEADISSPDRRNIAQEHVNRAKTYIRLHYMNPIHVRDVTDFVGLERSYLSKIFHIYTGSTIQGYIAKTRIGQAKVLLADTDYSVREISSYVGFQDEYYFSRMFKKEEGVSPQAFRRTADEQNAGEGHK